MESKINEKDGRVEIKFEDNHTLANLLRKKLWEINVESGYDKGHPYVGKGTLVIKSDEPKDSLGKAIEGIENDLDEFEEEFKDNVE